MGGFQCCAHGGSLGWLLVGTAWTTFHLVSTDGLETTLLPLYRGTIFRSVGSFQSDRAFAGLRTLTLKGR